MEGEDKNPFVICKSTNWRNSLLVHEKEQLELRRSERKKERIQKHWVISYESDWGSNRVTKNSPRGISAEKNNTLGVLSQITVSAA